MSMEETVQRRLSTQLDTGEPRAHREHFKFDNAYDESQASTPRLSPVTPSTPTTPDVAVTSGREARPVLAVQTDKLSERKERRLRTPDRIKLESPRKHRFRNLSTEHQPSILDHKSSRSSAFFGFYTLFWVTIGFMIIRSSIYNYMTSAQFIGSNITSILARDLLRVAATDLLLYLLSFFVVFWQVGIKHGYLEWPRYGWIIQYVWQAAYLYFTLWFSDYMNFPWIGCVFLLLHSLVLLMKQHSYSFYNGYFWGVKKELIKARKLLEQYTESYTDSTAKTEVEREERTETISFLTAEIEFCAEELRIQSETVDFPNNITFSNYFAYSMFPTVVYQIDYPRTERIRWDFVFWKTCATFGVFFLMIIVAENHLYPIAMRALALRDSTFQEKLMSYPFILIDLVPPFILIYLLVFYIIWDAILNAIAELTRFGDRQFYGEWWNCVAWDQFAKDWNVPVHRFLLRHVYHSSISAFHISKPMATRRWYKVKKC
jgi:sterol O-acyltransferase